MLATVQIVSTAQILIDKKVFSSIKSGCLIFLCVEEGDSMRQVKEMTRKIYNFRMLEGSNGITSKSLKDTNEDILIVSQFTLAAVTNKGAKPSFHKAAKPDNAKLLYDEFVDEFRKLLPKVEEGKFGAYMEINLINKGPVTFNFCT